MFWSYTGAGYTIDLAQAGIFDQSYLDLEAIPKWDGKERSEIALLARKNKNAVGIPVDSIEKLGRKILCIEN